MYRREAILGQVCNVLYIILYRGNNKIFRFENSVVFQSSYNYISQNNKEISSSAYNNFRAVYNFSLCAERL